MSSQRKTKNLARETTRAIATELIREPVKEAVRDALHEEAARVSATNAEASKSASSHRTEKQSSGEKQSQGGRSKGTVLALLVAIAGITYLARRRMSSTTGSAWTEPSAGAEQDAEGGYISEGEMQTAETSDDTEGAGSSPSTATEQ